MSFFEKVRNMNLRPIVEYLNEKTHELLKDIFEWLNFLYIYSRKKIVLLALYFEKIKDFIVDILVVKRGRYSKHFLNISFLFLVAGAVVGGPVIAEYYPTVPQADEGDSNSEADLSYLSQGDLNATTVVSDKVRFEILDYEIAKGDTLGSIAEKFGVSVDTIKWVNSMEGEKLVVGQKLKIPPVTGIVHKVAAGETIYSLAKKYQSDAQKIVNFPANDFADLDTFALNIGQIVFVPDGVMPKAAPVYRPAPVPQYIAGVGTGRFIWPAQGSITQYPVSYHMAVDIANRGAPPIAASDAGTVVYAGCLKWGYGCHVIINHGDGYQTLYGHLSQINVSTEKGQNGVGKGQVIGRMGSTGRSTGTHLHFEIRRNGALLNPLGFLSK